MKEDNEYEYWNKVRYREFYYEKKLISDDIIETHYYGLLHSIGKKRQTNPICCFIVMIIILLLWREQYWKRYIWKKKNPPSVCRKCYDNTIDKKRRRLLTRGIDSVNNQKEKRQEKVSVK